MELVTYPGGTPRPGRGGAVSIGVFDGVHRGHLAVIGQLRGLARAAGVPAVVVTFDPHPASVVRPDSAPRLLTGIDQRLELLEAAGIDVTVVVTFDHERSQEEPEEFVSEILVDGLGASAVVVGDDFHFGRNRRGDAALLRSLGAESGFEVVLLDPVTDGGAVSSTRIRSQLAAGDVAGAARLLGRPYELRGPVVKGDQRGSELGFPTANVEPSPHIVVPATGIYAGWYERPDGAVHPAAISVGRRPTFHDPGDPVVVEAFVIDFAGDLYGEEAKVRFVALLRPEERFESVDALIVQMEADVAKARSVLDPK